MSMMRCESCDRFVDTDYDLEGRWGDTTYTCTRCCERDEEIREAFDYIGEPQP